jgi:hypothetical protein
MAFELLYQENRDLTARPLRDRRARPEDVVANNDPVFPVRRLAPDGVLSENSSVAIVLRFCRLILYWPVRWLDPCWDTAFRGSHAPGVGAGEPTRQGQATSSR